MSEPAPEQDKASFVNRIQPAYQQVAEQLRSSIVQGDVASGDRLPIESQLASLFGVSRSTIREALRVLSSERLVRTVRGVGGGSFVSQPDSGHVSDFLQTSIGLLTGTDQVSLDELITARELLEVPAAGFAAERATEQEAAHLRSESSADLTGGPQSLEHSRDFHFELLHVSGNRLIELMVRPVFSVLALRYLRENISPSTWDDLGRDHVAIADAIVASDADRAADLMREHIKSVGKLYREVGTD